MQVRFNYADISPAALQTMMKMEGFIKTSGLDPKLNELIKIRASQINGCAFCINMHTKEARDIGESEQRIYLLNVWREVPFYTDKERVVLELTEAVTRISDNGVSQDLYERVRVHVSEEEYIAIIMSINTINSWNRIAISTGMFPE